MTLEEALAAIEALKSKNAEILGEKKAAATKAAELEGRLEKIEKDAKDAKDQAEADLAKKAGDWDKREAQLKAAHQAELDKVKAEKATLEQARDKLVIDNALSAQLDEAGVAPHFKSAVLAMIKVGNKAAVEIDGEGNFAGKIGDKPVADFVKAWAASDEGKVFIANGNTGGGANGGKGGKTPTGNNPYAKETLNRTEQGRLEKHDRVLANKYRAEVGLPALAA